MTELSASQKITEWLSEFDAALQKEGVDMVMELFADQECFWRDLLAFTWNIHTFESREEIVPMLRENLTRVKPRGWQIRGPAYEKPMMIGAGFQFETSFAWGRGFLWLKAGKCWTMMTAMWELKGHEEQIGRSRSLGMILGSVSGRKSCNQVQLEEELGHSKQPYCLIVGGLVHPQISYQNGEEWKGRKAVVIGGCTSAHDICLDLWEQGASEITMVQKSETIVIGIQTFIDSILDFEGKEYDPGFDVDSFDIKSASLPYKVQPRILVPVYNRLAEKEAEFHDSLRKVGFKLHMREDGSGVPTSLLRRSGGYYLDVGASELIANGNVKVKSGVLVEEIKPKSVLFSDGSEVSADLIIYATGYGNIKDFIERLISKEAAEKVGLCWGLGSNTKNDPGPWEGELRNMWKPLAVPNLWITSGGFSHCRFHSRHMALQLKAKMEGIPTPVYTLPKSVK